MLSIGQIISICTKWNDIAKNHESDFEYEDCVTNKKCSYHGKRLAAEQASFTAVFKNHLNEDVIRLVAEYNLPCNRIRIDHTCWNDNSDEEWSYEDANDMDTTVCIFC